MLKFFDCNVMLGKVANKSTAFYKAEDLLKEMEYHNIEKALVFSTLACNCEITFGNGMLLDEIKGMKNLYPVAVSCPWETEKEYLSDEMKKIIKDKAYGLRFLPVNNHYDFSDSNLSEIMKLTNKAKLPVIIDYDQLNNSGGLRDMMVKYPNISFILAKVGPGNHRYIYPMLEKYKNLYIETSLFRSYKGIETLVNKFGAERLLYGSYMPLLDTGAAVFRIIYSSLKQGDKEKIAYKNMEKIISRVRS